MTQRQFFSTLTRHWHRTFSALLSVILVIPLMVMIPVSDAQVQQIANHACTR